VPIEEFLAGRDRQPGALVLSVSCQRPHGESFRYRKISRIKPKGGSLVTLAALLPASGGRVVGARIAYGAMAAIPVRAKAAERAIEGRALDAASVACTPALEEAWAASALRVTGRQPPRLASGAGHDAMMMASLTGIGMLFVRCGNGGISHHPQESLSADDADVAARVFVDFLQHVQIPA